jgi:hypothetical protein
VYPERIEKMKTRVSFFAAAAFALGLMFATQAVGQPNPRKLADPASAAQQRLAGLPFGAVPPSLSHLIHDPVHPTGALWEEAKAYTDWMTDKIRWMWNAAVTCHEDLKKIEDFLNDLANKITDPDVQSAVKGLIIAAGLTAEGVAVGEALAAAKLLLAKVLAAIGAFYAGTCLGQALDWGWDWWKELVSECSFSSTSDVYNNPSISEIDRGVLTALKTTTGWDWTKAGFDSLGAPGASMWSLLTCEVDGFLSGQRGDAGATVSRSLVLSAVPHMQSTLDSLPARFVTAANIMDTTAIVLPTDSMAMQYSRFHRDLDSVKVGLDPKSTKYYYVISKLDSADQDFQSALKLMQQAPSGPVTGPKGLSGALTTEEFSVFIQNCASSGTNALPIEEVEVVDSLLAIAGVVYPGHPSAGPLVAQWDAQGDNSHEIAMFTNDSMSWSDLFRKYATLLSKTGSWLNIDIPNSPFIQNLKNEGVSVNVKAETFEVFPNPATGSITVATDLVGARAIELIDLLGRIAATRAVTGSSTVLDVSHLPPGLYLVRVLGSEKALQRMVVVE